MKKWRGLKAPKKVLASTHEEYWLWKDGGYLFVGAYPTSRAHDRVPQQVSRCSAFVRGRGRNFRGWPVFPASTGSHAELSPPRGRQARRHCGVSTGEQPPQSHGDGLIHKPHRLGQMGPAKSSELCIV
jgi:hypothetical protein